MLLLVRESDFAFFCYFKKKKKDLYLNLQHSSITRKKSNKNKKKAMASKQVHFANENQRSVIDLHNQILAEEESRIFEELKQTVESTREPLEGNLFYYNKSWTFDKSPNRRYNLIQSARESTHMLEIGFNAGHSTVLALLANPSLKVTSVDICEHKYTEKCASIVGDRFGDRFTFIKGDSMRVLPHKSKNKGGELFDLVHVDGNHSTKYANMDVYNSLKLCDRFAQVIFDDFQKDHLKELWRKYVQDIGIIHPKYDVFPNDEFRSAKHAVGIYTDPTKINALLDIQGTASLSVKKAKKKKNKKNIR